MAERSALPQTFFEDPHEGQRLAGPITEFVDTDWTTALGPVPPGYVYLVDDPDVVNAATNSNFFFMRQVEDDGAGFAYLFVTSVLIAATIGQRFPYLSQFPVATDQFQPYSFVMEEGDILQFKCFFAPATNNPQARVSYRAFPAT